MVMKCLSGMLRSFVQIAAIIYDRSTKLNGNLFFLRAVGLATKKIDHSSAFKGYKSSRTFISRTMVSCFKLGTKRHALSFMEHLKVT